MSAPSAVAPSQPAKESHLLRNILVAFVVSVVVIAAVGFASSLLSPTWGTNETWQQYEMSIQYPSGVKTQYVGVLDQQADMASGEAEWLWNGGNTGLVVAWVTTTNYNSTAGLQNVGNALLTKATNVVLTEQGNVTMARHSWRFQTYSFTYNGSPGYLTLAVTYYGSSGRAYVLGYIDATSGTFASLEGYGNTFTG